MGINCACLQRRKVREKKNTEEIVIGINRQVCTTKSYLHFDCFAEDVVLCSKVVYFIVCRCYNYFCIKTKLILLQTLILLKCQIWACCIYRLNNLEDYAKRIFLKVKVQGENYFQSIKCNIFEIFKMCKWFHIIESHSEYLIFIKSRDQVWNAFKIFTI